MQYLLLLCTMVAGMAQAQRSTLDAVNDTTALNPGIPVTLNLLANDTIPAGDSVKIIMVPGGNSPVTFTVGTGGNVTFVLNQWGFSGDQVRYYKIRDYTLAQESDTAMVVFKLHDKSFAYLDINNVKARFNSSGLHFFFDSAQYEVPKGSGKTSIFSNALWICGVEGLGRKHPLRKIPR